MPNSYLKRGCNLTAWLCLSLPGAVTAYPCTRPPCDPLENAQTCQQVAQWVVEGIVAAAEPEATQVVCDHGRCADVYKPMPIPLVNVSLIKGTYPAETAGHATVIRASHCYSVVLPEGAFVVGRRYRFFGSHETIGNYSQPGFFAALPSSP